MYITLKTYLSRLEAMEQRKPPSQRRHVPMLGELASAIGLTPTAMSNIANNNIKQLSLETGGKLIAAVRSYGFPMEVSDLVAYRPAATLKGDE